jgi:WD40 repeat protein
MVGEGWGDRVAGGEAVLILRSGRVRIEMLAFAPDGRGLASVSQHVGLNVWDRLTPNAGPSRTLPYNSARSLRYTPDGNTLVLVGYSPLHPGNELIFLHDLLTGEAVALPLEGGRVHSSCDITPDGLFLLTTGSDSRLAIMGQLACRSMETPQTPIWTIQTPRYLTSSPLVLPGGQRFALVEWTAHRENYLVTRETATGTIVAEFFIPRPFRHALMDPTGQWIAARKTNRISILHGANFAATPIVLKSDNRKEVTCLAFHPSGRYLAATSNDATVKIYDTETWKVAQVFTWEIGRMRSIAFSPDGMLAAAGSDKGQIIVWDFDL